MNATTSSRQPFIRLEKVTLRIGEERVFEQTTWEMFKDQHWAIIGPNGSGKTLLANAICRQIPLLEGRVFYFFHQSDGLSKTARSYFQRGEVLKISTDTHKELLLQYGGYHQARWQSIEGANAPKVADLLTGKSIEHISPYEVSPLKTDEAIYEERKQHAVQLLGIEYLLERKILHISHGEGRKVLLARALMQSPHLLILDDPFCGLDAHSRNNLLQILDNLLALGRPQILLLTARLDEIPQRITHLLRVERHRVIEFGPKQAILDSEFTHPQKTMQMTAKSPLLAWFPPWPQRPNVQEPVLVEMENTSVSYGDTTILQDINWIMRHGEHWAVLGPNGAGKTTLLSLILADNPRAYANSISLFGRRRGSGESIWEIKRHIGWVSPELQLYYHENFTCYHVICSGFFDSIGLYRRCSEKQCETAYVWMQAWGIESLADYPLGSLSIGEQRLVLLARALVKSPRLLILDEPCQGLDAHNRTHILALLDALCQQTSVHLVYVTHRVDEMPESITHILQLQHGRIRKIGLKDQILCKKNSTYE